MCLSLELDLQKFAQKNYRMLAVSGETSEASSRYAVSVPTTPPWRAPVLLLEFAARRRSRKSGHVAETSLREFLSNACSSDCLVNLRLEDPAQGDALGQEEVADDGSGTGSSRDMTTDGSATRPTQLVRGMVAAAQPCFKSAERRAWLRSLVASLSEDIDASVIHKRVRGYYDPCKHARCL